MTKIVLATINARYSHASVGLRYLYANMDGLQNETVIEEFNLKESPHEIAEKLLQLNPEIIGLGVYIWNASETSNIVNLLKKVSPETKIILGGPEVSHLPFRVDFAQADFVIQGEGDLLFREVCEQIFDGNPPTEKIIKAGVPALDNIKLPYNYYTKEDIDNRVIYVEASRGCPFSCEFCLSSLDKTVRYFDTDLFLEQMDKLWQKGVRQFKFIDRTFNLNIKVTNKILDFFLSKNPPYFIHFEVIPDHFPESLREKLKQFPPASLQLEIGIQTLDAETADKIQRKLNFKKIVENTKFLEHETSAHLHLDLIIGLPGETIKKFGENLNTLVGLTKSEIQLGILKKLSGTQINRHDKEHGMVYSDNPPYEILKNNLISFEQMMKMRRLARFWDLFYNSGNFKGTIELLWQEKTVFESFYKFSEWIYDQTLSTWQISLDRLTKLLFNYLIETEELNRTDVANSLARDFLKISGRILPLSIRELVTVTPDMTKKQLNSKNKRQIKHL